MLLQFVHSVFLTLNFYRLLLSERDYTLGLRSSLCYRKSVCRLSVVSLSVTFVHPTQGVEAFGNIFCHLVP